MQTGQRQQQAQAVQYRKAGYGAKTVAGAVAPRTAIVTPVLIVINVLVYALTAVQAQSPMSNERAEFFQDGVLWPIGMVLRDEWWRLLTSGFLHYGLIHIAMNMLALWVLGRDLEILLGRVRFIAVYFVSMLGGSAAVFAFGDANTGTAGASGAIYGLMGAILVAVLRLKLNPGAAIGIIVINVVLSISLPGISLLGHLGGLVVGALAMIAMVYAPAKNKGAFQAGVLALITAALVGLVVYRYSELSSQLCVLLGAC